MSQLSHMNDESNARRKLKMLSRGLINSPEKRIWRCWTVGPMAREEGVPFIQPSTLESYSPKCCGVQSHADRHRVFNNLCKC